MYRQLLQLLMLVILTQSTLAAADAHVLHEVSGEASHQHLVNADHLGADTAGVMPNNDAGDEQSCQHHCCHGHNFKYLNESLALLGLVPNLMLGWGYSVHYLPPLAAPAFRPPIV